MTKRPSEIKAAENMLSEILDDYLEAGAYPVKRAIAEEMRFRGIHVTTPHLSGGVKWSKRLTELTDYAQSLAIERGIYPDPDIGGKMPRVLVTRSA